MFTIRLPKNRTKARRMVASLLTMLGAARLEHEFSVRGVGCTCCRCEDANYLLEQLEVLGAEIDAGEVTLMASAAQVA